MQATGEGAVELYHNDENETYTAACWGSHGGGSCLVLGCASGRVQAWDASSAEMLGRPAQAWAPPFNDQTVRLKTGEP